MRYSLADYILTLKPNDSALSNFGVISVGGQGDETESISIDYSNSIFETTSYATGGYVHEQNLSKVGTASFTINQLSEQVARLKSICKFFLNGGKYEGFTLTLSNSSGEKIAECKDAYPTKIPTQDLGIKSANQTWAFTCGEINFE